MRTVVWSLLSLLVTVPVCSPPPPPRPHLPAPECTVEEADVVLAYEILGYGFESREKSAWVDLRLTAGGAFCARLIEPYHERFEHSWGRCRGDVMASVDALLDSSVFARSSAEVREEARADAERRGEEPFFLVHQPETIVRVRRDGVVHEASLMLGNVADEYDTPSMKALGRAREILGGVVEDCGRQIGWREVLTPRPYR